MNKEKYDCYVSVLFRCISREEANSRKEAKEKAEKRIRENLNKVCNYPAFRPRIYYIEADHTHKVKKGF